MEILQIDAIKTLLEHSSGILPIACGGGGVPVARIPSNPNTLQGVEAVIDKDACGAKLANEIDADGFIILTDGGGIWENFGKLLPLSYEGCLLFVVYLYVIECLVPL